MLIFDFNALLVSNVAAATKELGAANVDLKAATGYFLNTFLDYKKKFSSYGEVVIACDSPNNWRKTVYPYYKINRKTNRAKMPFDWALVEASIKSIQRDMMESFPYTILKVDGCEADDIIATICKHVNGYDSATGIQSKAEEILILSADQDFLQLQAINGVKQWSTNTKKFLVESNPSKFLFDKILKGDSGDGVVNILSEDNAIANGIRQSPVTQARIDKWTEYFVTNGSLHPDLSEANYKRNKTLVDLMNCVPIKLEEETIKQFEEYRKPSKIKLQSYLIANGYKNLYSDLQYF